MAPSAYDSESDSSPSPQRRQPWRPTRIHIPNHGELVFEQAELERLRMSMGFTDMDQLVAFIRAPYVIYPFREFIVDYLRGQGPGASNPPSLDAIITLIVTDTQDNTGMFTTHNPDKTGWGPDHHWARFIQQVYSGAQAADSSWVGVSEQDFAVIAWQLLELLQFLARRWLANRV
ncbi:hypothetical protein CONLIGDRAFT_650483 [Coniochaeta ligniaria NRRL 30616]|uniref:Uncharacterized protein n=1 Tax=Coniochaeta ligniaria NRRL 30616 TaxID=1408157 RepID=A0A1J7I4B0_9PEZI|nr:hypothetical protein CONLIGDRAFT_650483 [Coniochaeta ligniaria NRRL 30616]